MFGTGGDGVGAGAHFSLAHESHAVPLGMKEWQHAAHTLHAGATPGSLHTLDDMARGSPAAAAAVMATAHASAHSIVAARMESIWSPSVFCSWPTLGTR